MVSAERAAYDERDPVPLKPQAGFTPHLRRSPCALPRARNSGKPELSMLPELRQARVPVSIIDLAADRRGRVGHLSSLPARELMVRSCSMPIWFGSDLTSTV